MNPNVAAMEMILRGRGPAAPSQNPHIQMSTHNPGVPSLHNSSQFNYYPATAHYPQPSSQGSSFYPISPSYASTATPYQLNSNPYQQNTNNYCQAPFLNQQYNNYSPYTYNNTNPSYPPSYSTIPHGHGLPAQSIPTNRLPPPPYQNTQYSHKNATSSKLNTPPIPTKIYYCEPCDKEYNHQNAYEAHCATHEKCRHPGCSFEGTKKVVIAHFHGTHGQFSGTGYKVIDVEGQKFRVLMGTCPKEIEEWRAERRNKFPSKDNITKKIEKQSKFIHAGGLLPKGSSLSSQKQNKNQNQKQKQSNSQTNKRKESGAEGESSGDKNIESDKKKLKSTNDNDDSSNNKIAHIDSIVSTPPINNVTTTTAAVEVVNPCPFPSIQTVLSGYGSDDDNKDNNDNGNGNSTVTSESISCDHTRMVINEGNGNGTLVPDNLLQNSEFIVCDAGNNDCNDGIGGNGNGDGDDDDTILTEMDTVNNVDVDIDVNHTELPLPNKGKYCRNFMKGRCKFGKRCKFVHDIDARKNAMENKENTSDTTNDPSKRTHKSGGMSIPKPLDGGCNGSLLKKLLESEVSAEENIILQCFRFISYKFSLKTAKLKSDGLSAAVLDRDAVDHKFSTHCSGDIGFVYMSVEYVPRPLGVNIYLQL
eukprot:gene6898-14006_t